MQQPSADVMAITNRCFSLAHSLAWALPRKQAFGGTDLTNVLSPWAQCRWALTIPLTQLTLLTQSQQTRGA
jgi:hypothetical protein